MFPRIFSVPGFLRIAAALVPSFFGLMGVSLAVSMLADQGVAYPLLARSILRHKQAGLRR
jgi:hypothetical protein